MHVRVQERLEQVGFSYFQGAGLTGWRRGPTLSRLGRNLHIGAQYGSPRVILRQDVDPFLDLSKVARVELAIERGPNRRNQFNVHIRPEGRLFPISGIDR